MCGIVGMAGDINTQHKSIFKDLLTVCQLRGRDATGAVRINSSNGWHAVKRTGLPDMLIDTKMYDREIDSGFAKVLFGHCRSKTFGANNNQNAHPFDHKHIIGVHNGTLKGAYNMEDWRNFDVDSDWLFHYIAKYGIEETIPQLDADGAWALVWWDVEQKTINFIRNKERPLWFCHSEDKKVMYWASEPWWFAAIERRGLKLWDGGEDQSKVYQLPTDILYSFEVNGSGRTPQDIFNMKQTVELKGEVRGHTGNLHGSIGAGTGTNGGGVPSPFQPQLPVLDDNVTDIGANLSPEGKALRQQLRERITNQAASTITSTIIEGATNGIPSTSVCRTGSRPSPNSGKQRLSLPPPRSKTSPLVSSDNTCGSSNQYTQGFNRAKFLPLTDLREVGGISYITDRKTGREFAEHDFDRDTNGRCCFCSTAIGGLEEVDEIFVTPRFSFVCKACKTPSRQFN